MIFKHLVPLNIFGITPISNANSVAAVETFIVDDVQRCIYAQTGAGAYTEVAYIPALSDGANGIAQLARGIDARYNSYQTTTGFGASISAGTLTISYPNISILWDGAMQTVGGASFQQTGVVDGTYSFGVSYQWGLTTFQVAAPNTNFLANYVELCQVTVSGSTATVAAARNSAVFLKKYGIPQPVSSTISTGIPTSTSTNTMPW